MQVLCVLIVRFMQCRRYRYAISHLLLACHVHSWSVTLLFPENTSTLCFFPIFDVLLFKGSTVKFIQTSSVSILPLVLPLEVKNSKNCMASLWRVSEGQWANLGE